MEKKRNFVIGLSVCDHTVVATYPGKVKTINEIFDLPLGVNYGTHEELRKHLNKLLDQFFESLEATDNANV